MGEFGPQSIHGVHIPVDLSAQHLHHVVVYFSVCLIDDCLLIVFAQQIGVGCQQSLDQVAELLYSLLQLTILLLTTFFLKKKLNNNILDVHG